MGKNGLFSFQRAAYKLFPTELKEFYLLNVASVDTRKAMSKHFGRLNDGQLYELAEGVSLMPPFVEAEGKIPHSREFLLELLITTHERKQTQLQVKVFTFFSNQKFWATKGGGDYGSQNKIMFKLSAKIKKYLLRFDGCF